MGTGRCQFPFGYKRSLYIDCMRTGNGTAGICKDSSGEWQQCVADRQTVTGATCRFPLPWPSDLEPWLDPEHPANLAANGSSSGGVNMSRVGVVRGTSAFGRVATDCVRLPVDMVAGVPGFSGSGSKQGDSHSVEVCMVVSEEGVWKMEQCAARPGSDSNGMLNARVGKWGDCREGLNDK